ncbi:unnamed protein product [Prorocentrum cordatum]|uniref:Uncharacterized protein n=1 Tax=Prorocentrum cordatum TaxID=2364126 RepID=A0ABN9UCX0_9DINO|nr:unnamed protein product [Polarella glacialis]
MIHILRLPCRLANAVCSVIPECSGDVCVSLSGALSEACKWLCGALKMLAELFCELWSASGILGGALLLTATVNGVVIWAAISSIKSKEVEGCPDRLSGLIKTDLVLAIFHVAFVVYLKVQVELKVKSLSGDCPELRGNLDEVVRMSFAHIIWHDLVVVLYLIVWLYSFYENFLGVGIVAACDNWSIDHLTMAHTCVDWEIAYAALTVFFGCYLHLRLTCPCCGRAGRSRGRRHGRAHAREGLVPLGTAPSLSSGCL